MANLGNLPKDIIRKIAEHLEFYEDFENFGSVCSSLRSVTKEANFRGCVSKNTNNSSLIDHDHTLPWLMVPPKVVVDLKERRFRFYSLYKGMFRYANGASIIGRPKLLSSYGWLFYISKFGNVPRYIYNPFSGTKIELPELDQLFPCYQGQIRCQYFGQARCKYFGAAGDFFDRFVLSANPSTTSDFTVFLSLQSRKQISQNSKCHFAFWRNGDDDWTHIVFEDDHEFIWQCNAGGYLCAFCCDIAFYQGEFYGISREGALVKFDTADGDCGYEVVADFDFLSLEEQFQDETWLCYLVESRGRLLVVRLAVVYLNKLGLWRFTEKFHVYELNLTSVEDEFKEVRNLGDRAIFIGSNSSFSVTASPANCFKPNCIYFTHDRIQDELGRCQCFGEAYACVYDLADGKIEWLYRSPSESDEYKLTPVMWVESPASSC